MKGRRWRTGRASRADYFGLRDLLAEASVGVGARPGRLILTTLGTVLGIASVVVTVGLAQTAGQQINERFDQVAATQVVVTPAHDPGASGHTRSAGAIPWDGAARVARLSGVRAAVTISPVAVGSATVRAVSVADPSQPMPAPIPVAATSADLVDALGATVVTGRYFDAQHDSRADRVVVLGAHAAQVLQVTEVGSQPSVFIGDTSFVVVGIVDGLQRRQDLRDAVLMPQGTARAEFGLEAPSELQARIDVGGGKVVGAQAPVALDPGAPDAFTVRVPPEISAVREHVQGDVNATFLALGAVALLIGGLGIANVSLLSVTERIGEIGLRRALGASRREIAAQFVVESSLVGLLGGMIGAAIGVGVVVVVSSVRSWSPVLDLGTVVLAAVAGGVIGLVAGLYPALKAASVEPIAALRAGL